MSDRRAIPGWPGYFVDEEGRVFSSFRRVHLEGLLWGSAIGGPLRELKPYDRRSARGKATPYVSVSLTRDLRHVSRYVHELVALAFLGPRPEGAQILHGPAGSRVNRADNLRYGTPEENSAERVLCSGDAWYLARGLAHGSFESGEHCFADLVN